MKCVARAFYLLEPSLADESREPDSIVVVEYAGRYRGNHHTCDNDGDAVPVLLLGRHPVADDYVEQHRRLRAVDSHLARQHGPITERGDERADNISAAAAEHHHHGSQYGAAVQRDGDRREVRRRGSSGETISVSFRCVETGFKKLSRLFCHAKPGSLNYGRCQLQL